MTYLLFSITQEYESGPVQSDDSRPPRYELPKFWKGHMAAVEAGLRLINKPKTYVQPGFYLAVALGITYMGWIAWGISR